MKYSHPNTNTTPFSLPFGGMFTTCVSRFSGGVFDGVDAVMLLTALGYRILPAPKPAERVGRLRSKGRPPTFKMPGMKASLLGQVLLEADSVAEKRGDLSPLSNSELLRRLKKNGRFPRHQHSTLKVELTKARNWARSDAGQRWIEQAGAKAELFLQQHPLQPQASSKALLPERRLAGTVSS